MKTILALALGLGLGLSAAASAESTKTDVVLILAQSKARGEAIFAKLEKDYPIFQNDRHEVVIVQPDGANEAELLKALNDDQQSGLVYVGVDEACAPLPYKVQGTLDMFDYQGISYSEVQP